VDLTRGQGAGGTDEALEAAAENDLGFLGLLCLFAQIYVNVSALVVMHAMTSYRLRPSFWCWIYATFDLLSVET